LSSGSQEVSLEIVKRDFLLEMMTESELSDIEHFYSDRMKRFEEERQEITNYIHLIGPEQSELHILQWQERQLLSVTTNFCDKYYEQQSKFDDIMRQIGESGSELHAISQNNASNDLIIRQLSEFPRPLKHDTTYFFEDRFASPNSINRKSRLSLRNPDFSKVSGNCANQKLNSRVPKQVKEAKNCRP
jgi:hypothetical protein